MNFQVFGETVGLAAFSGILSSVGSVVPFHDRGIDQFADRRSQQIGCQKSKGSENQLSQHFHNPTVFPSLPHSCIAEFRGDSDNWLGISSWSRIPWSGNLFAINFLDSTFIRCMLITGEKDVCLSTRSFFNLLDYLFTILGCPWAWNDREQKTTFRINRGVVPTIALAFIFRLAVVHCLFFLSDERPLFVELNLSGLRGKKKPARREHLERVYRSISHIESPCPYSHPATGWWPGFRSLPEGVPSKIGRLFPKDATQKGEFLVSQRSDNHTSRKESSESSCQLHSSRKTADCPCSEVQTAYNPYSDNKRPLWDAEKNPLLPPFNLPSNGTKKRLKSTAENVILGRDPLFRLLFYFFSGSKPIFLLPGIGASRSGKMISWNILNWSSCPARRDSISSILAAMSA